MNIAIFVSGNGSNCENIIRYFNQPNSCATVQLVISNKAEAYALTRAAKLSVLSMVLTKAEFNDANRLMPLLKAYKIDLIVLAGFLLMVPDFLIAHFDHRVVNIHPSLLPKFGGKGMYGHHVHEAVKKAGESETGITIHYVSKDCDGGDIIAQFKTPLLPADTIDDIESKVHILEQKHYPKVIESVILNRMKHF